VTSGAVLDHTRVGGGPAVSLRVLFLVRALPVGGAEQQLVMLATGLAARGHMIRVCTCYEPGPLAATLWDAGVSVASLGQGGAWDVPRAAWRLRDEVEDWNPDVVHGYMPTSNLIAALALGRRPRPALVWGVRASGIEWDAYGWTARAAFAATRALAARPRLIIANSEAGRRWHVAQGYPASRMVVIPNGVDTVRFHPDAAARHAMRTLWDVDARARVIGVVARFDPMKDHATALRAIAEGGEALRNTRFVLAGHGDPAYVDELHRLAASLGVAERVRWIDARGSVERVHAALDVHTSSSAFGEGFSNAIAESMASGVPNVATDVGDAISLIGDTGVVVPARDPSALARAWERVLADDPPALGARARERVRERFSVAALVDRTEAALREVSTLARGGA
jgi:glycosyltransferase involved in cell wall biosynthesis